MFERYTEKARRSIFFARFEASQFDTPYIETEHLLLGLLREDKVLANRFLGSHAAVESIRKQIEGYTVSGEKVSTSVDLPLSHDCKRVLAYAAEESERLTHKHIGTEHLLLGLLRENHCFAAQLLAEQGVTLRSVRQQLHPPSPFAAGGSHVFARLDLWLAGIEGRGDIYAVKPENLENEASRFALYAADPKNTGDGQDLTPAERLAQIQKRIDYLVEEMERSIANHEFEKARSCSEEERKESENLRVLREQYNLEESPPRVPFLCIEIIVDERFSAIQRRCDHSIAEGIPEVWLLEPGLKRAYTFTQGEGLREFRGGILKIANPPLEMDLRTIFD